MGDEVKRLRQTFNSDKTLSREWRVAQLGAMLRMLEEGREELHKAMFKDLHKSPHECDLQEIDFTINEVSLALRQIDNWMARHPAPLSASNIPGSGSTVFDPLGLVLVLGAWNYPVLLTLCPVVGALAAGNCVMVKPGSYAPETSHAMARLISQYLDPEAVQVCEGNRDVTEALLKQRFDMMFFTGSGFVGKLVAKAAAEHLTPVVLELGGKSPFIVEKTADLDLAATRLAWASFLNSGQTCIRPDFLLVDDAVATKFLPILKAKIAQLYSADPQKTEWFGRVINLSAFDRLKEIIEQSKHFIVHGGRVDRNEKYIEPTLLDYNQDGKAFDECPAMQDENFGPVLPILRYKDFEQDVIQRIRRLPTGKPLALYLFTEDSSISDQVVKRTSSGGMCINDAVMHIVNEDLPFGGVGNSGMGSYHGFRSFKAFSHEKALLTKYSAIDQLPLLKWALSARYPPFDKAKITLGKLVTNPTVGMITQKLQCPSLKLVLLCLMVALVGKTLGFRITRE